MSVSKWNRDFIFEISGIYLLEGVWVDQDDTPLPEVVQAELGVFGTSDDLFDIILNCNSTGYYDSGSMYGGSDHMGWPPEGEDERTPLSGEIRRYTSGRIGVLSTPSKEALFDTYLYTIENVEIDRSSD